MSFCLRPTLVHWTPHEWFSVDCCSPSREGECIRAGRASAFCLELAAGHSYTPDGSFGLHHVVCCWAGGSSVDRPETGVTQNCWRAWWADWRVVFSVCIASLGARQTHAATLPQGGWGRGQGDTQLASSSKSHRYSRVIRASLSSLKSQIVPPRPFHTFAEASHAVSVATRCRASIRTLSRPSTSCY